MNNRMLYSYDAGYIKTSCLRLKAGEQISTRCSSYICLKQAKVHIKTEIECMDPRYNCVSWVKQVKEKNPEHNINQQRLLTRK